MRRVLVLLIVLSALSGCGDDGGDSEADRGDTTEAGSQYDEYVALAEEAGEEPISQDDAAARAALDCDEANGEDLYGDVPITEFPTDLALVKAYCPDRLEALGG